MTEAMMLQIKFIIRGLKLYILASFTTGDILIAEYIGVTHTRLSNGKEYKTISYHELSITK